MEFDLGLMPETLRPLVEDVAERMQLPLDFQAVTMLAALAGVTNRRAMIQPKRFDDSWRVIPNLWGAMIGPPGVMKSPLIANITRPIREVQADWRAEYELATPSEKKNFTTQR